MTSYVFPGQGSQEPGMGREFYESRPEARAVFELGNRVTGRDLAELCFSTDAETLSRTENAQLAVFTVSMAALHVRLGGRADGSLPEGFDLRRTDGQHTAAVAGFSLGECSALVAAGALPVEDGFKLVQKRGKLMQKACDAGNGAMSALLGGDPPEAYEERTDDVLPDCEAQNRTDAQRTAAWAMPVNFNCPGQTVVAGTPEGVAVLEERCRASGGRVARLALSGAFHTRAMKGAAEELQAFAQTLSWKTPVIPVYTNLTGEILPPDTDFPAHLAAQMQSPVLWQKSIENMRAGGVTEFIEVGHGKSLTRLIKRIAV